MEGSIVSVEEEYAFEEEDLVGNMEDMEDQTEGGEDEEPDEDHGNKLASNTGKRRGTVGSKDEEEEECSKNEEEKG